MTKEDKAAYATIRKALDLLDYHVGCGNLTDEESAIYEAADEALAWFENTAPPSDVPQLVGYSNIDGGEIYRFPDEKEEAEEL
jgi:hypothetical protein